MAITINQQPTLNTHPAFYPAIYVVKESVIGAFKFSYTLVVGLWNGSSYDDLATFRVPVNSDDAGVWDVSSVVQAYIPSNVPQITAFGNVIRDAESAALFRFTFGSEQATTANSAPVANASTRAANGTFYGGTRGTKALNPFSGEGAGFLNLTKTEDRAMTSYGLRTGNLSSDDEIRYFVRDEDWGCLDFLYNVDPSRSATSMRIRYFNGGTQLSTTSYTLSSFAGGSAPDENVLRAFVYPGSLELLASGTDADPTDATNDGWTHYIVDFQRATTVSRSHFFERVTDCVAETPVRFMWQNEFGGWDFIRFEGRVDKEVDVNRNTYTTERGNWYTTDGTSPAFTYDKDSRGDNSIPSDYRESYTVYTGLLRPEQNSAVESLFRSRDVYATQVHASDSSGMYPVHFTGKQHRRKTARYDGLIEYQFKFQYANQPHQVTI